MRNYYQVVWNIFGMLVGIFNIFWSAFGIHQMLAYHWNPYLIIPVAICGCVFGIFGLGTSFQRLLKQFQNTSIGDLFTQIGIGIIMSVLFVVTIIAIGLVWASALLYSVFQWLVTNDGYTHNKCKCGCGNINKLYKPLDPKLEQEFDTAFSKKPFPKPYSPTDNPLYQLEKNYADWKAKLPPFDREKVFEAVDDSNVRMSETKATLERIIGRKKRHSLRGEKGQFIKRSQAQTPITRYGVPTSERFGKQ